MIVFDLLIEPVDPEQLLRHFTIGGSVIFPTTFQPHPAHGSFLRPFDVHVPKSGSDGFRRSRSLCQLWQGNNDVDEKITRGPVVRRDTRWKVEVRPMKGALCPRDPE